VFEPSAGDGMARAFLMFSSDCPHWDADEPGCVVSRFSAEWHRGVFDENARGFYRLSGGAPQLSTDPLPYAAVGAAV
jgi:hypothetical protein